MSYSVEETNGIDIDLDNAVISLTANDGETFSVPVKNACVSTLVSTLWTNSENTPSDMDVVIDVSGAALGKIVEYMNNHAGNEGESVPTPLSSCVMKEVCADECDATYIDTIWDSSKQLLYDVAMGANYMGMHVLTHLACAKVGSVIRGKPIESIKGILVPTM
jgi:hypothetical protein